MKQEWLNSIAFLPLLFSRLYLRGLSLLRFLARDFQRAHTTIELGYIIYDTTYDTYSISNRLVVAGQDQVTSVGHDSSES